MGPDNGLLARVAVQATEMAAWRIDWQPEKLSASFHGRDLFAPVAAMLATGRRVPATAISLAGLESARKPLAEVIYLDGYGNAMTGLPGNRLPPDAVIQIGGCEVCHAPVFGEVPEDAAFWYVNSLGLVEVAVNQGSAAQRYGLEVGVPVRIETVS